MRTSILRSMAAVLALVVLTGTTWAAWAGGSIDDLRRQAQACERNRDWLEACRCYASQFDDERWEMVKSFLTGFGVSQGARCGFRYGELFALPAPVGTADLHKLLVGGHGAAPEQVPGKDHLPMG